MRVHTECPAGYSSDGNLCIDDDECALGTFECIETSQCVNTPGSYECDCDAGYFGPASPDGTATDSARKPEKFQAAATRPGCASA